MNHRHGWLDMHCEMVNGKASQQCLRQHSDKRGDRQGQGGACGLCYPPDDGKLHGVRADQRKRLAYVDAKEPLHPWFHLSMAPVVVPHD